MKQLVIIILYTILSFSVSTGQVFNPINMNFEQDVPNSTPTAWNMSDRTFKKGYRAVISDVAYSGSQSLLFSCDSLMSSSQEYDGLVFQSIFPTAYLNQTIKFSAYARAEYPNDSGSAYLWVKVYLPNNKYYAYPVSEPVRITSSDWRKYEVTAQIPPDATEIQFGVILQSEGKVWLDLAEFENTHSVPYSSINLSNSQLSNLVAFSKLFSAVSYFYPRTDLDALNRATFAEYGVERIINNKSKQIDQELQSIFSMCGKSLVLSKKQKSPSYNTLFKSQLIDTASARFRLYSGVYNLIKNDFTKSIFQLYSQSHRASPAYLSQRIDITDYVGKTANLSAYSKFSSPNASSKAYMAISALDSNSKIIDVIIPKNEAKRTGEHTWNQFKHEYSIPLNCKYLNVNLVLEGDGNAIFDGASCTINGEEMLNNGGFESGIGGWKFDNKCSKAGYEIVLNQEIAQSGKTSVELCVLNDKVVKYPTIEDIYEIKLNSNLYAYFPKLSSGIDSISSGAINSFLDTNAVYGEFESANARIAAVITAWSILDNFSLIKHIKSSEIVDKQLANAIGRAATAKTQNELAQIISELLALFPDNSIRVWSNNQINSQLKGLPINLDYFDKKLIITKSLIPKIKAGSEILKINDIETNKYLADKTQKTSGSSDALKLRKAITQLKYDYEKPNEKLSLKINKNDVKDIIVERRTELSELENGNYPPEMKLAEGVYYLDFRRLSEQDLMKFFKSSHQDLTGLLIDLRGYSSITEFFFKYFKSGNLESIVWQIPIFTDYIEQFSGYQLIPQPVTGNGKLSDVKIVALCDESTIGLSESNLHLLRRNGLSYSVGRKTSGTPTEVIAIPLPCSMNLSLSFISASDDAGNLLIGNPFTPDLIVEPNKNYELQGKDTLIEVGKTELLKLISK